MYVLEFAGKHDEFGAYEAQARARDVSIIAPGLATASEIAGVETLAFTHRASERLGYTSPDITAARELLQSEPVERTGTVAVRAVDVRGTTGIDTQQAERELGTVLVEEGLEVDLDNPDHELRALFSAGETGSICTLGWLTARSERGFGRRKPGNRPFFQPGSMDPMLARALANIVGAGPGQTILDPMCGTGGILIEAGLVGASVIGVDAQEKMVQGSRQNLAEFPSIDGTFLRGDVSALALVDDCVDGVVFDTPYGRQSKIEGTLEPLIGGALSEAARVASKCVVMGDRAWREQATAAGWTVDASFERRVHRSLTRHILVLERD